MIAALFVEPGGIYDGRADVELWPEARDARLYAGPHPVVAHPPCERWGNLWWSARHHGKGLGDDGGCFAAALAAVERWGGVLEHPEGSRAWDAFGLPRPHRGQGWVRMLVGRPGWACSVDQGAKSYGHAARKRTWLYYFAPRGQPPAALDWSDGSTGVWVAQGPRGASPAERAAKGITLMVSTAAGKRAKKATPPAFAEVLLQLARGTA